MLKFCFEKFVLLQSKQKKHPFRNYNCIEYTVRLTDDIMGAAKQLNGTTDTVIHCYCKGISISGFTREP